ncbi:MAG TPA: DUF11 domain-containing protein [Thermoanaerobaculia bacterium]|nr:DUF11 domain-containing protein [Thermoanaerobaculia bacterium]
MSRSTQRLGRILCLAVALLAWGAAASAQTVVVADNLQGWGIGPFGTAPTAGFVAGPGTPPLGTGSYATSITVANSKIILGRNDYHDQPLGQLTALSFWTFVDVASTTSNNWYINLYVDRDGNGTYDHRLDYVPPTASVVKGVWQQWDAFTGTWFDSSNASSVTLASFLSANPNARFNAFNNASAFALRFNMGDTASTYVGFVGNLDAIRVAVTGVSDTTWDFEPPTADLSITKTNNATSVVAGDPVNYTIVAANAGPSNVTGATVTDTFPAVLQGCTWACTPAGGATCTAGPVAGNLNDVIDLPAGGSATYAVACTLSPAANGTVANTATITAPQGVTDPDSADVTVTDSDPVTAISLLEIPTLSPAGLAGLALLLFVGGVAALRKRRV